MSSSLRPNSSQSQLDKFELLVNWCTVCLDSFCVCVCMYDWRSIHAFIQSKKTPTVVGIQLAVKKGDVNHLAALPAHGADVGVAHASKCAARCFEAAEWRRQTGSAITIRDVDGESHVQTEHR